MRCPDCGQDHPIVEMELAFRRPDAIAAMSPQQRAAEVRETSDLSAIRNDRHFVRALLPLPLHGNGEPYNIGMWAEVSLPVFDRVRELWSEPDQAGQPAMEATLANALPGMDTLGLAVALRLTGPDTRPELFVADGAHPLAREQAQGISVHRAGEYTSLTGAPSKPVLDA